jgi:hypothetical protein
VTVGTVAAGVDFLGWTHFPKHRVLRRATRTRMQRRLVSSPTPATVKSYVGMLGHGDAFQLQKNCLNMQGLSLNDY